jgi:hypothetical protein
LKAGTLAVGAGAGAGDGVTVGARAGAGGAGPPVAVVVGDEFDIGWVTVGPEEGTGWPGTPWLLAGGFETGFAAWWFVDGWAALLVVTVGIAAVDAGLVGAAVPPVAGGLLLAKLGSL